MPEVTHGLALGDVLRASTDEANKVALDNYESSHPLHQLSFAGSAIVLAVGSERGWSAGERDLLRQHHFQFAHLGARVLRTETAVIAALTLIRAKLGL